MVSIVLLQIFNFAILKISSYLNDMIFITYLTYYQLYLVNLDIIRFIV